MAQRYEDKNKTLCTTFQNLSIEILISTDLVDVTNARPPENQSKKVLGGKVGLRVALVSR